MESAENEMTAFIDIICNYVDSSEQLLLSKFETGFSIEQRVDGKSITVDKNRIADVLTRMDSDGKDFLQVNFNCGKKILITERLIGFKPIQFQGIDLEKLPKVVTTPDLGSVVDAISDGLCQSLTTTDEIDVLKRVFHSVLLGAEAVGFELNEERDWLARLVATSQNASA